MKKKTKKNKQTNKQTGSDKKCPPYRTRGKFVKMSFGSSRSKVLRKKDVPENFTKFIGKHLCQSLFNKVAGLRPATLRKKRLWHSCFM